MGRPANPKKFFFGKKGFNRVVVWQHEKVGAYYIAWYDGHGQRFKKSVGRFLGTEVVYDEEVAIATGKQLAKDLAGARTAEQLARAKRQPIEHTLGQLLQRYHFEQEGEWSDSHRKAQERFRHYFLDVFDPETPLQEISASKVQNALRVTAQARGWSKRSVQAYMVYIKAAFRYANRMLRWIPEAFDLRELKAPSANAKKSDSFAVEEVKALLEVAPEVDLRMAAAIRIAVLTGRRSSAIAELSVDDITEKAGHPALRFREDSDKAGKEGIAIVDEETEKALVALLNTPLVKSSGLLFPHGSLKRTRSKGVRPVTADWLAKRLRDVEDAAGVEHVDGRGMHGFKRTMATLADDRKAASKQTGTNQATLERYYEKDNFEAAAEVVEKIAEKIG